MADAVAQTTSPEAPASRSFRIHSARPDGSSVRCTTDGEDILVPRVPASYLRSGDHVRMGSYSSPIGEYLATQNSLRRKARQLYFGHIGCVSQRQHDAIVHQRHVERPWRVASYLDPRPRYDSDPVRRIGHHWRVFACVVEQRYRRLHSGWRWRL